MLSSTDRQTIYALRQLEECVRDSSRPLLVWIGAGASAWCGYPTWANLADDLHSQFSKLEAAYDAIAGASALGNHDYPEVFEQCKRASPTRYFTHLSNVFEARQPTPVYRRLLTTLEGINPKFLITTNVDEMLEQNLNELRIVQKLDVERCIGLLRDRHSFVAKLHGSVSSVQSMVFTRGDYEELCGNESYLSTLRHLFAECSTVFIGYSLSDDYVLSQLTKNFDARKLFGDGPHFIVSPRLKPLAAVQCQSHPL